MAKRFPPFVLIGLAIVVCGIGGLIFFVLSKRTIHLSASEIQSEISRKFPVGKSDLAYRYRFDNPKVSIDEATNQVSMMVGAEASALGSKTVRGHLGVSGSLRYDSSQGSLYLDQPRALIADLEMADLPEKVRAVASSLLAKGLEECLRREPLYRLNDKDSLMALLRRNLKSLRVQNGEVVIELGL